MQPDGTDDRRAMSRLIAQDRDAERGKHALRVIATRRGLGDVRPTPRTQTSQEYRGLDLSARHRKVDDRRIETTSLHRDGQGTIRARLKRRTHTLERFRDTTHRSGAQRCVSDER